MPRQTAVQTNVAQGQCRDYEQKQHSAMASCVCQIIIALILFSIGIAAYLIVDNIHIGAFWPAIALVTGAAISLAGLYLKHAGKSWMVAGIVFTSLGIAMAFIGAVVDGVGAGLVSKTDFAQCRYTSQSLITVCSSGGGNGFFDLFDKNACSLSLSEKTCYCCYLYSERQCEPLYFSFSAQPYRYQGVDSCGQVEFTYKNLLWASVAFNVIAFFVGVVCAALVSAFKSMIVGSNLRPATTTTTVITTQNPQIPVAATTPIVIYNTGHPQNIAFSGVPTVMTPPPEYQPNPYMHAQPHGMHGAVPQQPTAPPLPYAGEKPPPYSL
ncbi:transmembrane protein 255B-like isoform X2 [Ptychodera flava]|uniref:transmembrane protein 255B-like isoform X2 n=1 Tax=Ptychodera flava TaxID=63121 RepID=UPI00396A7626